MGYQKWLTLNFLWAARQLAKYPGPSGSQSRVFLIRKFANSDATYSKLEEITAASWALATAFDDLCNFGEFSTFGEQADALLHEVETKGYELPILPQHIRESDNILDAKARGLL